MIGQGCLEQDDLSSSINIMECPNVISINMSASTSPISVSWEEPTAMTTDGKRIAIFNQSHSPGTSFPVNSNTIVTYVFDDISVCSFNIVINVKQVISSPDACECEPNFTFLNCPLNITSDQPAFCGTVPVNWTEPTVIDGCGGSSSVEKTHEPGSEFPAGVTTVTYTFTDSFGNQSICEFDVIVPVVAVEDDSVPPVVSNCPAHIYEVLEPSQTSLIITWDPPTARDDSGLPVSLHQTHSPGDQFTAGGYELVQYTFTDAAGNEAVCEFAVTVYPNGVNIDTQPPTVPPTVYCPAVSYTPPIITVYVENEATSADYNFTWPTGATDNDGVTPTVIASHQEGIQSFPIGFHRTAIFYYDTSGNRKDCYQNILVRRQGSAPTPATVINCPQNVYLEIPEGTSTRVCWEEPVVTDDAGNPIAATLWQRRLHSGAEFFINGNCNEQFVGNTFYDYYGNVIRCGFSVTIRAIGHENLPGQWTQWYNRDRPGGNCDCDTTPSTACSNGEEPIDVQCETLAGDDWLTVGLIPSAPEKRGQVAYCCPRIGFYCWNRWNALYGQQCLDYRVRFKCPLQ
ncbi:hyalin-like [Amphiura filiformis]|uniref:hyalin-like n=1 Tax=Amphiura filiformis TaxID=82378 RepID=UPI003B22172C